ncbi:bifunctional metallophosphatase/5'-nucleotidase [Oceanobacillus damuensis]|uniref:bifunctional metallophosphatase/5'-nucleotidase n=1 Tax=Oceanobacillus damuensis TaxID=937928 RepID=UPI00082D301E|nr:bifunctional UDP-sugar hydrolase/5'-nucleotidase [Oceanobacillus damuensis]
MTLLYTSDIHGNAMPVLYGTNEKADIGLVKYASVVKEARQKSENIIAIDNGDLIQGTPLMTHYVKEYSNRENPMIGIMNRIGIDAAVLGNHEFNFGKEILADAIQQSDFPWLSANILDESTNKPKFGPPYIIKNLENGVKAAIVGVTTHYIPNWEAPDHIKGVHFADAFKTLEKWIMQIRETENPDVLIVSYHGGFERDLQTGEPTEKLSGENQGYQMCQEIEGIDILLTGHQHRRLSGMVNDVLILQPGNNGQAYGKVEIELEKRNERWVITDRSGSLHELRDIESDSMLMDYMEEMEKSTQRWLDQPIGYIEGDMTIEDPFLARVKKHPFIQFIQDVQMDASGIDISVTSLLNNTSTGFGPVVTMRDIVSNYMYPNTLVVLELTGQDIKDALEKSAEYFTVTDNQVAVNPAYIYPKPQHYNYDMWEGITYTIQVSNPVGTRVRDIFYQDRPIDFHQTYHVVLNNYRASGGGNYDMFKNKPVVKEIQKDAVEMIREYFEKNQKIQATANANFTVQV